MTKAQKITVRLTDANGIESDRKMALREILNFVSGNLKQGKHVKIITDGGKLACKMEAR